MLPLAHYTEVTALKNVSVHLQWDQNAGCISKNLISGDANTPRDASGQIDLKNIGIIVKSIEGFVNFIFPNIVQNHKIAIDSVVTLRL